MSLRSRNAHGHLPRAVLCENAKDKCHRQKLGQPLAIQTHCLTRAMSKNLHEKLCASGPGQASCVSLHNRNAYGHLAKAILILCENSNKKMLRPKSGTTVCASLRSRNACEDTGTNCGRKMPRPSAETTVLCDGHAHGDVKSNSM